MFSRAILTAKQPFVLSVYARTHGRQSHQLAAHKHHEGLLFFLDTGVVRVRSVQQSVWVSPGQLGWIPPEKNHAAQWFGVASGFFMYVHASLCPEGLNVAQVSHLGALEKQICLRLHQEQSRQTSPIVQQYLLSLLQALFFHFMHSPTHQVQLTMPSCIVLRVMTDALIESPDDERSIEVWSAELGLSTSTILRRFKAQTGLSFSGWRQQLRMLKALELLGQGHTVTDTALALGYHNISAFIAMFRRYYQCTPGEFVI